MAYRHDPPYEHGLIVRDIMLSLSGVVKKGTPLTFEIENGGGIKLIFSCQQKYNSTDADDLYERMALEIKKEREERKKSS